MSQHEFLSLDHAKCWSYLGFPEPFPWRIATVTLPNEHSRWGRMGCGVHLLHLSQTQSSAELALRSHLQFGYARHFGLVFKLNAAVVTFILASSTFYWKAWIKVQPRTILSANLMGKVFWYDKINSIPNNISALAIEAASSFPKWIYLKLWTVYTTGQKTECVLYV